MRAWLSWKRATRAKRVSHCERSGAQGSRERVWRRAGGRSPPVNKWIDGRSFIEAKPGLPIIFENLVSGMPRVHKICDQAFWTNWPKVPAAAFSRFLAVAEKGKPTPAVPRPPGKTAGQQKIDDLESCVRYTRDLLTKI